MRSLLPLSRLAAAGVLLFPTLAALEYALVPSFDPVDHRLSEYANAGGFAGVTARCTGLSADVGARCAADSLTAWRSTY